MTKTMRWLSRCVVLVGVAGMAACDEAVSVEGLEDTLLIDAAMVAADATIEEARMWREPFLFGPLPGAVPGLQRQSPAGPGGRGS